MTILLAATTVLMADLLEKPGLQFRGLAKWTAFWAGTGANAYYFKPTIFEKPEDIVKSKGIIYGQSAGVASYTFLVVKEFVGIPTERVILGYGGSAEGRRAFHAGETTGTSESNWGYEANLRPYVEKGEVKILFQTGAFDEAGNIIRHPGLPPDILTGKELYEKIYGKAPSGLAYEAYKTFIAISLMEKLMIVPPGVPQEISRTYWVALQNVVKDPEVQKMGLILPTDPAGEAADKLLKDRYGIAPDVRTWLRDLLAKKYDLVL
ncbi:MAG: hypothetical protein HYX90_00195 [Chloroflexi bacterium]|nr:hypothetical protein [Chloroflexota bacterium]